MADLLTNVLLSIGAAIVIIISAIYTYLKKKNCFWKEHGVPGPEPKLLIGNMGELVRFKMTEAEQLDIYYQKYKNEKYIGIYTLWTPTILVRDAELVKRIMETDFEHFMDHNDVRGHVQSDSVMENLFTMKGETWKSRRVIFTRLFTPKKLKDYSEAIQDSLSLLIKDFDSTLHEDFEITPMLHRYFVRLVCSIFYGFDVSKDDKRINKFIECAEEFASPPLSSVLNVVFYNTAPDLFKLLKIRIYPLPIWEFFSSFTSELISVRKQSNVKRNDFLDLIIKLKEDKILDGENITFEEAVGHVFLFFTASHHTTELTLCHVLLQLALRPEIQNKVREEVKTVTNGSTNLTYEHMLKMSYLDAVIAETLRMYVLVGVLKRVCTKPYKLDDKFTVPKGFELSIPAASIHMDPKNYPEPEKFKPERFYNKEAKTMAWMPFGKGPRTCIGMLLGELSVKLALAKIMIKYTVQPSDKMQLPMKFDARTLFITNRPIGGFWFKFKKIDN